jgi:hypothetical protein
MVVRASKIIQILVRPTGRLAKESVRAEPVKFEFRLCLIWIGYYISIRSSVRTWIGEVSLNFFYVLFSLRINNSSIILPARLLPNAMSSAPCNESLQLEQFTGTTYDEFRFVRACSGLG